MTAKFLVRLDDACPTMDHEKWEYLEKLFDEFSIKPLVAVVPDNTDKSLIHKKADPFFWKKALSWQNKSWGIALHGYQHNMHPTNSKQILPFYKRSEFSGLPYEDQALKIRKGYKIMQSHGLNPNIWIGPAHCFNKLTLKAIANETPIKIVSDGMALNYYYEDNFYWIPQQLWNFKKKDSGLWTICIHPNTMSNEDLNRFRNAIIEYKDKIISLSDIKLIKRKKSIHDKLFNFFFWKKYKILNKLALIKLFFTNGK
tara:strand:- start:102 stop:869 length:768 start_codon:yes stop_codon:yes gene_type:complete